MTGENSIDGEEQKEQEEQEEFIRDCETNEAIPSEAGPARYRYVRRQPEDEEEVVVVEQQQQQQDVVRVEIHLERLKILSLIHI